MNFTESKNHSRSFQSEPLARSQILSCVTIAWLILFNTSFACSTEIENEGAKTRSFRSIDDVEIAYSISGSGPPLVLVHGFSVNADLVWHTTGIASDLAQDYTVVTLDVRGHGASEKPIGTSSYGEMLIIDIVELLDHLDISRASIIGYSMGGKIALKTLSTYSDRVSGLIVIGTGLAQKGSASYQRYSAIARKLRLAGINKSISSALYGDSAVLPSDVREIIDSNDRNALISLVESVEKWEVNKAALKNNNIPSLAVMGSKDSFLDELNLLTEVMGGLETEIIPHVDHYDIIYSPLLLPIVRGFLQRITDQDLFD